MSVKHLVSGFGEGFSEELFVETQDFGIFVRAAKREFTVALVKGRDAGRARGVLRGVAHVLGLTAPRRCSRPDRS